MSWNLLIYTLLPGGLYVEVKLLIKLLEVHLIPYLNGTTDKTAVQRTIDLLFEDLEGYNLDRISGQRLTDDEWDQVAKIADTIDLLTKRFKNDW